MTVTPAAAASSASCAASAASFAAGFSAKTGTPRRTHARITGANWSGGTTTTTPSSSTASSIRSTSSNADAAPNRSATACARSRWRAHVATSCRSTTGRFGRMALTAWTPTPTAPTRITGSQGLVRALDGARAALAGARLGEAAASECRDRVFLEPEFAPGWGGQRAHVGLEGLQEDAVRAEHVAVGLGRGELRLVDEQRLRVRGLDVHRRLHHRVDLPLDVVRLVDHERNVADRVGACDLAHDPEQLE